MSTGEKQKVYLAPLYIIVIAVEKYTVYGHRDEGGFHDSREIRVYCLPRMGRP